MAQQRTLVLTDDLDGSPASETVEFALDGAFYEIELNAKNAKKLRDSLGKFVTSARRGEGATVRPGRAGRPKKPGPRNGGENLQLIRTWARDNGFTVSDRGVVRNEIITAYQARPRP